MPPRSPHSAFASMRHPRGAGLPSARLLAQLAPTWSMFRKLSTKFTPAEAARGPRFQRSDRLALFLGVPVFQPKRANVAADGVAEGMRYGVETIPVSDENTGQDEQALEVRRLNVRILLSTDDMTGYETIPIARIEKSQQAEAVPQLDLSYFPPVVACDGWSPLQNEILQAVYDRIGKKIELLASQVVTRGITFDSQAQGDPLIFAQLRELNEAYAMLGVLCFAQGVHPLTAYLELCRVVGQLSVFGATRRPPELPRYDHDDLGGCFYTVKKHIDALLNIVVEPTYKERAFIGAALRMQVSLEPSWLESIWQMLLGVQTPLSSEECNKLLTKPGQLDMKIGSSDRVDDIFRLGQAGLKFAYNPRPPRALPSLPGLSYFQVSRESQAEEWQNVQKSLTLAIRLNENRIAGNIQGQRILTIKTGGQNTA